MKTIAPAATVKKRGRVSLDVDVAPGRLEALIAQRAARLREEAEMEARSQFRQADKRRRARKQWAAHYLHMSQLHASLSKEHWLKARALLEGTS